MLSYLCRPGVLTQLFAGGEHPPKVSLDYRNLLMAKTGSKLSVAFYLHILLLIILDHRGSLEMTANEVSEGVNEVLKPKEDDAREMLIHHYGPKKGPEIWRRNLAKCPVCRHKLQPNQQGGSGDSKHSANGRYSRRQQRYQD